MQFYGDEIVSIPGIVLNEENGLVKIQFYIEDFITQKAIITIRRNFIKQIDLKIGILCQLRIPKWVLKVNKIIRF
jgi:hypothetical protein